MSQQPSQQPQIELNIDGVPTKVEAGTTGANIYADRKEVVAVKVDGQPWDLERELPAGAAVEPASQRYPRYGPGCAGAIPAGKPWYWPVHH